MVSISGQISASHGMSYFDKDSYYSKEDKASQWYGRGAKELGLEGGVNKDEFGMVINGFGLDGKALVRNAGSDDILDEKGEVKKLGRRAYADVTFSAPKSVSILSYTDDRIEAAHNRAVERTIGEIEKEYAHTRLVEDGEINTVKTDNLCMARFNHHESRELDPQLHSHIVLMNLTKGDDGKWRSLETGDLYKNQLYLGQFYRNTLARELKDLGYEIEVTDRNKGLYEIKGVSEEIRDEFSTRRKQVEKSLEKYENYNATDAKKAELACLDSRRKKTDSKVEEIRQDVENRLEKYGQTLEGLKALAIEKAQAPDRTIGPARRVPETCARGSNGQEERISAGRGFVPCDEGWVGQLHRRRAKASTFFGIGPSLNWGRRRSTPTRQNRPIRRSTPPTISKRPKPT